MDGLMACLGSILPYGSPSKLRSNSLKIKPLTIAVLFASIFSVLALSKPKFVHNPQSTAPVRVDQKILETYVGRYTFKGDVFFDVTLEDGSLHLKMPGQEKATLAPSSQSDFLVKEVPGVSFTFDKDSKGEVIGLTAHQGGDHKAKKISTVVPDTVASKFDPTQIDAYVGEYEVQAGFTLTVTNEKGKLMAEPKDSEKIAFKHDSGTDFSSDADGPKLHFMINDDGQVVGMKITLEGKEYKAKKIK